MGRQVSLKSVTQWQIEEMYVNIKLIKASGNNLYVTELSSGHASLITKMKSHFLNKHTIHLFKILY